jgi:hypothetical protein
MVAQPTPWRHASELAMVRDWLYPQHVKQDVFSDNAPADMRQRAIDKVNLWLFKFGSVPPAVSATAKLTEAILHDDRREEAMISDSAMRSVYAMAFTRFVNGFVDRDVARNYTAEFARDDVPSDDANEAPTSTGKGESSMYAHAMTIGMPSKFVDLRHQVTHADIPNLIYLRRMTEEGLEWLWERWWVKHATASTDRALREVEERKRITMEAREADLRNEEAQSQDNTQTTQSMHGVEINAESAVDADTTTSLPPSKKRKFTADDDTNST